MLQYIVAYLNIIHAYCFGSVKTTIVFQIKLLQQVNNLHNNKKSCFFKVHNDDKRQVQKEMFCNHLPPQ